MTDEGRTGDTLPTHGASNLPAVEVDSYNLEITDRGGFVGDKACKSAFWDIFDKWRTPLRKEGEDPFEGEKTADISKKQLADELAEGDVAAAALVQSAVEDYARQFTEVIRKFLKTKEWKGTECIAVGGGFRGSRVGELAIARAALLLREADEAVALEMIHNDPDDAGLLGAAYLLPTWMLKGLDGMLAVDIGGTNIRAGVISFNMDKANDLSKVKIAKSEIWRHAGDVTSRDAAVKKLASMLEELISWAQKKGVELTPVIGIGCPGIIKKDGTIDRGGQNLPGNWESASFNLPASIKQLIPFIDGEETMVVVHNDAVVQGLSEICHMRDHKRWGILTIGTGLGNARFTNR